MATTRRTSTDSGKKSPPPKKPAVKKAVKKTVVKAKSKSVSAEVKKPAKKAAAAKPEAKKAAAAKTRSRRTKKPQGEVVISSEERHRMISEAAYFLAEKRGFQGGNPHQDWLDAAAEVDEKLMESASS